MHETFHSVTYPETAKIVARQVARAVTESRIRFYFPCNLSRKDFGRCRVCYTGIFRATCPATVSPKHCETSCTKHFISVVIVVLVVVVVVVVFIWRKFNYTIIKCTSHIFDMNDNNRKIESKFTYKIRFYSSCNLSRKDFGRCRVCYTVKYFVQLVPPQCRQNIARQVARNISQCNSAFTVSLILLEIFSRAWAL